MRESFILYTKYEKQIEKLSMEQRGVLLTAILAYESGSELPEMDDRTDMAFEFIRIDLDENNTRYEKKCRQNAESGRLGGRPKKAVETEKTERFSGNRTQAEKADNDYENDYENENEPEGDSLKEKEKVSDSTSPQPKRKRFEKPTVEEVRAYCLERHNNVDAETFVDFYDSKGWFVGKTPMKDWKASVRTWERSPHRNRGTPAYPMAANGEIDWSRV